MLLNFPIGLLGPHGEKRASRGTEFLDNLLDLLVGSMQQPTIPTKKNHPQSITYLSESVPTRFVPVCRKTSHRESAHDDEVSFSLAAFAHFVGELSGRGTQFVVQISRKHQINK